MGAKHDTALPNAFYLQKHRPKKRLARCHFRKVNKGIKTLFYEYVYEKFPDIKNEKGKIVARGVDVTMAIEYLMRRAVGKDLRLDVRRVPLGTCRVHPRALSEGVKTQFHSWCVGRGYTMLKAIQALMKRAVKEEWNLADTRSFGSLRHKVPDGGAPPL